MSLRYRFGVFCFALIFVTAYTYAFADPPTTESACTSPDARPPVVESFSIVHLTEVTAIKSTIFPNLPGIFEAIGGGAKVNNYITYDRKGIKGEKKGIQFTNKLFLVVGGVEELEPFAFIKVRVDEVDTLCRSDTARDLGRWVSVSLKGTIIDGVAVFGSPIGDDYTYSFAYKVKSGDPSQFWNTKQFGECDDGSDIFSHPFRELNSVDPGRASDYRDCADGHIFFWVHP